MELEDLLSLDDPMTHGVFTPGVSQHPNSWEGSVTIFSPPPPLPLCLISSASSSPPLTTYPLSLLHSSFISSSYFSLSHPYPIPLVSSSFLSSSSFSPPPFPLLLFFSFHPPPLLLLSNCIYHMNMNLTGLRWRKR